MPFRPLFAVLLLAVPVAHAAPTLRLAAPDAQAALAADAARPGAKPWRFAVPVPVAVSPRTHGAWTTEAGKPVWRLAVSIPGAKHLNFGFTDYRLPAGATLTLRSLAGPDLRGPYTSAHSAAGQLWTPVLRGESTELVLRLPDAASRDALQLQLTQVGYGFRGFGAQDEVTAKSGACNVDVACPAGDEWRDEIRSVARYTISGALLCTGSMVNNTAGDFTPYFLTASHCIPAHPLAPTTVFYWNYETATCGGTPNGSLDQTQTGSVMLSTSAGETFVGSDFVLLQLLQAPPAEFKVYYSGWDRRDRAPVGVTGIHHPAGDEKRISHDFDGTAIANYIEEPTDGVTGTHIKVVRWDVGVTEGGSSGSGIWNTDHRLVGTLSGGYSSCQAATEPDWYGRMYSHWTDYPTPLTSLEFWLDPAGSGAEVLDGADPNGIRLNPPRPSGAPKSEGLLAGGSLPAATLLLLAFGALRRRAR